MPALPRPFLVTILAVGFAAAHTQAPLFYSNQNQYLLHGLATAGYGQLSADWLSTTADPTPLFSAGVAAAYRAAGLWPLQAAYFALLMGYFAAAAWLAGRVADLTATPRLLAWAALFTAAHAAVFRVLSVWLTGVDYPWIFQAGVAGQYLLGPGIQPSAFGGLLLVSVAAFAAGRAVLAGALAGAAGLMHATYLLPGGLLVCGYLVAMLRERRPGAAASVGAVSLLVVLPTLTYAGVTFAPDDRAAFAEAQRILAEVRIPHHAVVSRWFDAVAAAQLVWVALGLLTLRRTRVFLPLTVAATGALVLTLVVTAVPNPSLMLLFPWRLSAVLVPVATLAVAARAAAHLPAGVSAVALAAMAAAGVWVMAARVGYATNTAEEPLLEFVRTHAGAGDVVLIPTRFPAVGTGRGSVSTSFTPPPRPRPGSNLIPVDLQRFRLATGVPIYVDFKSVPYADDEVLEWHRRVAWAEAWYAAAPDAAALRRAGITLVVSPRDKPLPALGEPVFADEAYHLYRVR
ncbi:DUF6798 domain-containing protein [Urbifossiella limnaea]|uniref:DUF6798 domain-containing protein n=1 Tax=Urbifossiella limnaea TaxID=2528023 RepID=A0A517XPE8_9BACT|nr:DUF6798 domain-containing protein [Urbifossiella limnaea]QDU19377.1 hypothetical protein ETAA1_13010 [Urbifossiella limnaea]